MLDQRATLLALVMAIAVTELKILKKSFIEYPYRISIFLFILLLIFLTFYSERLSLWSNTISYFIESDYRLLSTNPQLLQAICTYEGGCYIDQSLFLRLSWLIIGLQESVVHFMGTWHYAEPLRYVLEIDIPFTKFDQLGDFHNGLINLSVVFGLPVTLCYLLLGYYGAVQPRCRSLYSRIGLFLFIRTFLDSVGSQGLVVFTLVILIAGFFCVGDEET
jgi:hypothetical protein